MANGDYKPSAEFLETKALAEKRYKETAHDEQSSRVYDRFIFFFLGAASFVGLQLVVRLLNQ